MKTSWRRPYKKLHLWMGLPFWGILFFICITGTLAVISYELTWLFNPNVRASEFVDNVSINKLVSSIESQVDGARVMSIGFVEPYLNYVAYVVMPEVHGYVKVWIDASNYQVTQVSEGVTLVSFLRALHGWLLIPSIGGLFLGWYIVCFFAIPLLISLITGLVIYKKFYKGYTNPKIHTDKGSRPFWISLHKVFGVYSIWLGLIMAISSIWFIVIMILYTLHFPFDGGKAPLSLKLEDLPVLAKNETKKPIDIDTAYLNALKSVEGLTWISMPESSIDTLKFKGNDRAYIVNDKVSSNPYTGEVMDVTKGEDRTTIMVISEVLQSLHFGKFGGISIKIIWFIFGAILSILILSGMIMWIKKNNKERINE